jgi:hypothetical protein
MNIMPMVMNRTCTPHTLANTNITFDKPSRDTIRIISGLHIHSIQWLQQLLRTYRIKSFAAYKHYSTNTSNPPTQPIQHLNPFYQEPPREDKCPNTFSEKMGR